MKIHTFTSTLGIPWVVKLVPAGRMYGFEDGRPCLVAERDLVEFYDGRYDHTHIGQFVSHYYAETLANRIERGYDGLNLHGGEPDWQITSEELVITLCALDVIKGA